MGYIYMINRSVESVCGIDSRLWPEGEQAFAARPVSLTNMENQSVFYIMKKVYRLLDDWKTSRSDKPLLLMVDSETAPIVHSYFYDMSSDEYDRFSMKSGEVRRYWC